jgi:autotransporter-associated beta strand protein
MADKYFVGASGGTWNNTATSWSLSDGGTAGSYVPVDGDVVYVNRNISANSFVNVNQNIGNITKLVMGDRASPYARWFLSGTAINTAGSTWTLSNNIEINVPVVSGTTVDATIQLPMTGTGGITKTGPGSLEFSIAATRNYSGGVVVSEGYVGAGTTNSLGATTGTISLADGTGIFSASALGTTTTLANPITINGNVKLGGLSYASNNGTLSLTGLISIPGTTTRTITVDSFASSPPTAGGGTFLSNISSTSGFVKEGIGQLYLYSVQNNLFGPVTVNDGALYLGWDDIGANTFSGLNSVPNISLLTIGPSGTVSAHNAPSTPTNITMTHDVVIDGTFGVSNLTTTGTYYYTFSGNVSGTGTLFVGAYNLGLPNASYISKVRSNSTPAILGLAANGSSSEPRSVYWQYTGGTQTFDTDFLIDQGGNTQSAAVNPHFIENIGTGRYTTTGGIDLNSTGAGTPARTLTIAATNGDFEIQGTVKNTNASGLNINKTGSNRLVLSGDNTFTGTTTLTAGTLEMGSNTGAVSTALAFSTLTPVSGGGTLEVSPGITTAVIGNVVLPIGTTLAIPSGVEYQIGNKNVATTQIGAITGSNGILAKIGTNTLALSVSTNSFGTLKLYNGTISFALVSHIGGSSTAIQIGHPSTTDGSLVLSYTTNSDLTLSNNFTLYEGFTSTTTRDLVLNGTFSFAQTSGSYTLTASGNMTLGGVVSGDAGSTVLFAPAATKKFLLSTNNTSLLSALTISSGFLTTTNAEGFGPSSVTSNISVESGAYLYFDSSLTIDQPNRNTYLSGAGAGNGALYFNAPTFSYSSPIVLEADSTISNASSNNTSLSSINVSSFVATVLSASSATISFSGSLAGTGTFVKSGAGTVELDAASTFTGTTSVTDGTLAIGASDATGGIGGSVSVSGGTLKTTVSTGTRLKTKDLTFSGGNLKIGA